MNAELNPRQIARIERIRAERAAAKGNKHYYRECVGCGDTPCVKPDDPIDPPYCEYCSRVCDERAERAAQKAASGNKDRPMKVSNLNGRAIVTLKSGLMLIHTMKMNGDYFECIKAITELMELFKGDAGFHKLLFDLRDEAKNLWREKLIKKPSKHSV